MKLEWTIARRYLASRRGGKFLSLITLISIVGVTVGVMALIVVTSVMSGLQTELREKILGTNPHIWVTQYGDVMVLEDWPQVAERVREHPRVVSAGPFVHTEVGLRNRSGHAEFAVLRGIDPDVPGEPITDIAAQIREGRFDLGETESGFPPLLVGESLANRFGLYVGEVVDLISMQDPRATPMGFVPRMEKFEVRGRFRTGMFEYDNKFMYTSLGAAQEVVGLSPGLSSGIEVRVADLMRADVVASSLRSELGFPYRVDDWQQMNAALFGALELEKQAMALILLLIVIVAAFGIVSTLVMMVADKTREIGILKSMGLTSRQVRRIFMIQGVVIGMVGAVLGFAGGMLVTWAVDRFELISIPGDVYFIDRLPVAVEPLEVSLILGATVIIAFLATIYPAVQASRLQPVEAIRHD
jgi:lipoprotein-releasing system permease protein